MNSKILLIFVLVVFLSICISAQDVTVNIALKNPVTVSRFKIGVTYTSGFWEYGNQTAVNNAKNLLVKGISFQNQHIMGWGAGDPEPQPGVYSWKDLDHRVELMQSIGAPAIITFCTAPGWMKGSDDWSMEKDVEDAHFQDFTNLCARIASRYPDVKYFQVWNEMKGFWNTSLNNWDYVRYTNLYNMVYDAVKLVRPDAKIGGPYIPIQGDGGIEIGKSGRDTYKTIGDKDWQVIDYWLKNKNGADFFCFDYSLIDYHDTNTYTFSEKMKLTKYFGLILEQLSQKTDLPIFISEFYGGDDKSDEQFTAANHASCYLHAILNNASAALIWNPQEGEIDNYLFTKTDVPAGGQPSAHYYVVEEINHWFSNGTVLYNATSSSDDVEVLSSAEETMLINKTENMLTVNVNGQIEELNRYEVKFLNTPSITDANKSQIRESSRIRIIYSDLKPYLQIDIPSLTDIQVRIYDILGRQLDDFNYRLLPHFNTIGIFSNLTNLPSGIYFVTIKGPGINSVQKFHLLK